MSDIKELKEEYETLNSKLKELTDKELAQVSGSSWVYQDIEISLESEND